MNKSLYCPDCLEVVGSTARVKELEAENSALKEAWNAQGKTLAKRKLDNAKLKADLKANIKMVPSEIAKVMAENAKQRELMEDMVESLISTGMPMDKWIPEMADMKAYLEGSK